MHYTINHTTYTLPQLIAQCQKAKEEDLPAWEKAVWSFIEQWFDSSDYITLQTSGSTGTPKQLKVEKKHMSNSALMTLDFLKLQAGNSALLCLSADYIAGKMMIVRALLGGLDLILGEPLGNPLKDIKEQIDFAAMVPLQVQKVIEEEGTEKLESIRHLIIGGAAVSPTLASQLAPLNSHVWATYGMTETVSHIALKRLSGDKLTDAFTPLSGVSISTDQRDCLVIDAPHLCPDTIVTNDMVSIDEHQHFTFLGRYDNIINSGGVKLVPESIEAKISHLIKERFIISSLADERLGQKVVLVIESTNKEIERSMLIEEMKPLLTNYELPRQIICVPQFKETKSGKIMRQNVLT